MEFAGHGAGRRYLGPKRLKAEYVKMAISRLYDWDNVVAGDQRTVFLLNASLEIGSSSGFMGGAEFYGYVQYVKFTPYNDTDDEFAPPPLDQVAPPPPPTPTNNLNGDGSLTTGLTVFIFGSMSFEALDGAISAKGEISYQYPCDG